MTYPSGEFHNVTKIKSKNAEKWARELRSKAAIKLKDLSNEPSPELPIESHFRIYADKLPLLNGIETLQFNYRTTELALDHFLRGENDPEVIDAIAAKIVEQTFYEFFDIESTEKPQINLSVSKHYGVFFTPQLFGSVMASKLAKGNSNNVLLDPCLGSGSLICAALINGTATQYTHLIGIDADPWLAHWAHKIITRVSKLVEYKGKIEIKVADGLEYLLSNEVVANAGNLHVILNPPYGRIRITKDRASNTETALSEFHGPDSVSFNKLQNSLLEEAKDLRVKYSIFKDEKGILEKSRLFFRACGHLALKGARVAIITPDSWLSGSDSKPLREFLLRNGLLSEVILIKETEGEFATVNQSTSITILENEKRESFCIHEINKPSEARWELHCSDILMGSNMNLAIPRICGNLITTFERVSRYPKMGDMEQIINARGEVDQTALKHLFSTDETSVPLIRGDHIERYWLNHQADNNRAAFIKANEFIDYIKDKPKEKHFCKPRIVGKQCSYAQQSRRLHFALVPSKCAVGNSCNYISLSDEFIDSGKEYLILGLLNSAVLDWFFRIQNNNNHVGNYEIDNFPFPLHEEWFQTIQDLAGVLEKAKDTQSSMSLLAQSLIEAAVALAYGISPDELSLILDYLEIESTDRIVNYARQMARGITIPMPKNGDLYFNHENPTLSDLDKQVISHVPEGGNWQNIPESVPSKRLDQIREMTAERGVVRTTYYGRLRRDQPAYTINTYFNRPGNGTHIHPVLDRTLTGREAARIQSFPDDYIFTGSQTAIRNQIGNAVPPLLAKAIGDKLIKYSESQTSVDVFCGAGGLSLGLEQAGWHTIAAIDHDQYALDTYTFNRPCVLEPIKATAGVTSVFKRDLHDKSQLLDVVKKIKDSLDGRRLDLLAGGPPCQGFSHAGFRLKEDSRNDLASVYINMAKMLKPRIFILENVEGLMTYKKGKVLADIIDTLEEIGFRVHSPVWKLCAEQYGVPQMRRRVFVVATTEEGIDLSPPSPVNKICFGRRKPSLSTDLFDGALKEPHTIAEALAGLSLPKSSRGDLIEWLEGGK